ncbi:MAG: 50S ribosomal protein L25 [Pseudomonadales bacterium]|nr:50S ribosomal protein L25 [Pseudomonadales bacterium]
MTDTKNKTTFEVHQRDHTKKPKQLRAERLLPGNIMGLSQESRSIMMNLGLFEKLYTQVGETGLVYLQLAGEKTSEPVLVEDIQTHVVTGELMHVVFKRVNLKVKVVAEVPVELVGENTVSGANILLVRSELEVEALPADLPEHFTVDVSTLTEIGDTITIDDLAYDRSVVEIVLSEEVDGTAPVVILQEQKVEEEPEEVGGEDTLEDQEATQEEGGSQSDSPSESDSE